ncbi:uncharacterized protein V6R79_000641 [Siganus canaliculatus]
MSLSSLGSSMESGGRAGLQQASGGGGGGGGWVLVEARLEGGAPWGFTVQGGLEHDEPLIISKVEQGGKVDRLEQPLLLGDEIIIINDVNLTGYRQEAIALVKGSYKTLQLTVRRYVRPGYIEGFGTSRPSLPADTPSPPSSPPQRTPPSSRHSSSCSTEGVQLRIKNRRSEPASRPHSWHSTKLGEGQQEVDPGALDTMSSGAWHHGYHSSASTTDLSGGFEPGGTYLRKNPDQYSSRGSMESLDPPLPSHHHSGAHHHHPMGHHSNSGPHLTYSSCHQLTSARSSNSIDHLHSKRDSAYSSFSTSSSIPEYLASTPSFSTERSYSLETVSQRGGGSGDMQQADIRYVRTVYDAHQGLSQEHELSSSSAALLRSSDTRSGGVPKMGLSRDLQAVQFAVGGVCYREGSSSSSSGSSSGGVPASNRHSVGPIWGPATSRSSYESLKGVPAPPRRSDSYAAIRNHERPNSWSSLEHARSLRSLQKGSWHHSSGSVASSAAKVSYSTEGQLHTVIEKSPESSPTTKPRQGGGFPQSPSPTGPSPGPSSPPPQSGRFILPTSKYPVPHLEPHYAQIPSANPGPGSSGVYPALAKESSQQQHQGRDERAGEVHRDGRTLATENGHQNGSSSSHSYSSSSAPVQFRTEAHETERHQQEESKYGLSRPHIKTAGGGSEGQLGPERTQNHQGHHVQGIQGSHRHINHASNNRVFQEHNQNYHNPYNKGTTGQRSLSSQEWRDHCTPVQPRGERSRSMDQSSVHPEEVTFAHGQVPTTYLPVHEQPQAPPSSRPQSGSAALQYQQWDHHREQDTDREHPLTRLENALAEVQRCASPDSIASSHDNSIYVDDSQGTTRSLSVLEKVSRFERRERTGKPRSQSASNVHSKAASMKITDKGRNAHCGADDLRNMLERSASKAHRTLSYRGSSSKYGNPADPSSALQRSRSTYLLDDFSESNPWMEDVQEMLGPVQDTSTNRSYRDSVKDAQSKVLRSTYFKRKDLNSSSRPQPLDVPPPTYSSSSQPSSVPATHHSLEKKGPKTMPKPLGVVITPQSPPPVTSPHTPKERHMVSPDMRGADPPALPSIPPVGHPALIRICSRKRLAPDQKKRSYSEPENMNEVGVSDAETAALFKRGGETSVADRRKMFELAASHSTDKSLQNATSRPDLRQIRHDALAEYVERKRGVKKEEGGKRSASRPRSAYIQADHSNHTVGHSYSDTMSLSSTSSMVSLQDSSVDRNPSSEERRQCSTLPPGGDLRSFQSNLFYPGRVTNPRPPAQPQPSVHAGSPPEPHVNILQDLRPKSGLSTHSQSSSRDSGLGPQHLVADPQLHLGLSKQLNGALQRAESVQHISKSASVQDLLESSEETHSTPQHGSSRSSPLGERVSQEQPPGDVRLFGVFISEPGCSSVVEDRPADIHTSGGFTSPQSSHSSPHSPKPATPLQGTTHTPITRRERQRNIDRQRANSTSALAASVGLPCPFSSPGTQDGTEWRASERLSLANLDAITFPGIPHTGKVPTDTAEDAAENSQRVLQVVPAPAAPVQGDRKNSGSTAPSPPPPPPYSHPSYGQRLSSLRISESSLASSFDRQHSLDAHLSQEDYDEVFLQNHPLPSPPPPINDTSNTEDSAPLPPPPLPPPPLDLEPEPGHRTTERSSSPPTSPSSSTFPPLTPHPPTITSTRTSTITEDSLSVEYKPLPKRDKTCAEQRVETLSRQLVSQDSSLAPLLDTWGSKSTVQLMEEIFPSSRLAAKSPWQRRGSRIQDGIYRPAQSAAVERKETNLDEIEKDLNTRKVELCEALRLSVAALQQEKEALCEEQRRHQALGASIETLVQDRLKLNERDKYSMFIGDLEKIVNLLLSLCSRLSRIDRSLLALEREQLAPEDAADERESLLHKRSLLLTQTDDAQELKENLDRRQRVVHAILCGYFTNPQLQDYRCFVSTKPSLLIRQRQLDDLIRQGEEQLTRLAESLPQELAEAHGWSRASAFLSSSPVPCSSFCPSLLPPSVIPGSEHSVRQTTVTSL